MLVLGRSAVSYERGTPVGLLALREATTTNTTEGYLAYKKVPPPPQDHHWALDIQGHRAHNKTPSLGPYSGVPARALWWSQGVGVFLSLK